MGLSFPPIVLLKETHELLDVILWVDFVEFDLFFLASLFLELNYLLFQPGELPLRCDGN